MKRKITLSKENSQVKLLSKSERSTGTFLYSVYNRGPGVVKVFTVADEELDTLGAGEISDFCVSSDLTVELLTKKDSKDEADVLFELSASALS